MQGKMKKTNQSKPKQSNREKRNTYFVSGFGVHPVLSRALSPLCVHCVGMFVVTRQQINPQTNTTTRQSTTQHNTKKITVKRNS